MRGSYDKIGNIASVVVLIVNIVMLWGFIKGSDIMMYMLIAINLTVAPICLILYLREVKRGVFSVSDDEEE